MIAEARGVPVFRTTLTSKAFTTEVTVLLKNGFFKTTVHGVIYGYTGLAPGSWGKWSREERGGIGSAERGHSLVADDLVRIKLSDHTPVGFCDEVSRGGMLGNRDY